MRLPRMTIIVLLPFAAALKTTCRLEEVRGRPRTTWLRFQSLNFGSIRLGGRQEIGTLGIKVSVQYGNAPLRTSPVKKKDTEDTFLSNTASDGSYSAFLYRSIT